MVAKPKVFEGGRDMVFTLIVVVAVMVGFVLPTGLCSFEPGRPEGGPVQEVDEASFLELEARSMPFAVRLPERPEGWTANSARRLQVDGEPGAAVGYITADDGYLRLVQTGAPAEGAAGLDGAFREPAGEESLPGGATAEVFADPNGDARDVWVVDAGDARLMVSGAATDEERAELFSAALDADPLPGGEPAQG
ncbi:DUF4245 domain-containing protein [Corynebacterium otitidis]|nr:DUF4245 domain-containing protein [Corynebacterium otitidis]CCI82951.1 putative secreted protein [Corynebacterium otitidis ATCC 51513]